jgi:hypothetical protein
MKVLDQTCTKIEDESPEDKSAQQGALRKFFFLISTIPATTRTKILDLFHRCAIAGKMMIAFEDFFVYFVYTVLVTRTYKYMASGGPFAYFY